MTTVPLLYDPAVPNVYRTAKYARYRLARTQEAEARRRAAAEQDASPNCVAAALASVSSVSDYAATTNALSSGVGSAASHSGSFLVLGAEELRRERVRRSAEMGVHSAVQLQRDELEVEHKRRKLEGSDAKGRIHSLLGKMRAGAAANATPDTSALLLSSSEASASPSAAPLVFKPSSLAAGGYVMAEAQDAMSSQQRGVPRHRLKGSPSSTLLVRARGLTVPPTDAVAVQQWCDEVRRACGVHGMVRAVRSHVLTSSELEAMRERLGNGKAESCFAAEKVRVLVRFDTVASAFKAAEELPRTFPQWDLTFFPTALFDSGAVQPADGEPLCDTE